MRKGVSHKTAQRNKEIIKQLEQGEKPKNIAARYYVSSSTVLRLAKLYDIKIGIRIKLTPELSQEILAAIKQQTPFAEIAKSFGASITTIIRIAEQGGLPTNPNIRKKYGFT